jgi:hypothetical protein
MQNPSMSSLGLSRRAYQAASRTAGVMAHNMAIQDWFIVAFLAFMWLRVMAAPDSADASFARRFAFVLLTVGASTVVLTRGEVLRPGPIRSLVYRVGMFSPMVLSYLAMRWLLPALQPRLLDHELWAIDELLFGTTPALWMGQFNQRVIVEWFSLFYYSYFYILVVILLPTLFFDRGRRQAGLLAGAMLVSGIGHVLYTLVPGLGPYATITYQEPLDGGFFYELVWDTVNSAGAMLDIFPSLHTAQPVLFALFAFTYRRDAVYRYTWPILAFLCVNMVIATMFLRWHWAIDVVAGLALAVFGWRMGMHIAAHEEGRDEGPDPRQPTWEPLSRSRG